MRILYVQINNDYSGSSYALKSIIESHNVAKKVLMTSYESQGFLTDCEVSESIDIPYKFKGMSLATICDLFRNWSKGAKAFIREHKQNPFDIVYLNAISPWHIAIPAKILGVKVIYHVHEFYAKPNFLIKFYLYVMRITANKLIYVSEFCRSQYSLLNAARKGIGEEIQFTPIRYKTREENDLDVTQKLNGPIIMICSPKKYKGVEKFMDLARVLPNRKFKLFISQRYEFKTDLPRNVEILLGKTELQQELFDASLLLNLSQSPDWIETFGLTIWESLSQGTPVIVPDIGGPVEIVNVSCGKSVDVRNIELVVSAINEIFVDYGRYSAFCSESLKQSQYLKSKYPIVSPE